MQKRTSTCVFSRKPELPSNTKKQFSQLLATINHTVRRNSRNVFQPYIVQRESQAALEYQPYIYENCRFSFSPTVFAAGIEIMSRYAYPRDW